MFEGVRVEPFEQQAVQVGGCEALAAGRGLRVRLQ
jgi:hypothetical protein